jgi:ATP-dependent exoDNAse (exonuclease V) beta subunit
MKTFIHNPVEIEEISATTGTDGNRVYQTPDGKLYPSVTTVLSQHTKKGIMEWRERVGADEANKISRQAATRGTKFHTLAERYLKNAPQEKLFPDNSLKSVLDQELFEIAKSELNKIDNIRAQEVALWSHHLRLAGRVDCIAEYEGKLSVIDFKTARREKDVEHIQHYFMQASAYAVMFEERTGIPVNRLVIAIAVEDGFMQVFQSKRDAHIEGLLYYRDMYEVMK